MGSKKKDGERIVGEDPANCKHPRKYQYSTNDEGTHWICPDCATTDLG